jgi:hypothetical protein
MALPTNAIAAECERIEEDAEHSGKAHFNAAASWARVHLWLGLPTAVLAAIAGVSAFKQHPELAGVLAILVAAITAATTFLNPSGRASAHQTAGNQFLTLRNQTRVFRTVTLASRRLHFAIRFFERHWRQPPRRSGFGTWDRPHSLHQAR